jgi:membrane-associated phospholipid phosphatase
VSRIDEELFLKLNQLLKDHGFVSVFRLFWPLGKTPFTLILIALMAVYNWKLSLAAFIIYFVTLLVEKLVKRIVRRTRPFSSIDSVYMLQPQKPMDPSFPSGDAMRAWFLALAIPQAFNFILPYNWITLLLATIISLGRIAFGVHYPLDVLSGAGLGWIAAGIWIELANL